MTIYTVRAGDSLFSIAARYGTDVSTLTYANQLSEPSRLAVGMALVIPVESARYTVRRGDSLFSIAHSFGISLSQLISANPALGTSQVIRPGQTLTVPFPDENLGTLTSNGYAYPSITDSVLEQFSPYLTYLSPFSYDADSSGSLTTLADTRMIETARQRGTASLMTVTNLRPSGGFDSDIAHAILTDQTAQDNFLRNVLETVEQKGYYGVSMDFEYIYGFDRESYSQFLRRMARELHERGRILAVALAPKLSANQPGLLYTAHDYAAIGEIADIVILMTYEWGYTYGPAMAVAPINMVRRVLDYAVTEIPPSKMLIGVPNYGYDWTLPFVQGTAARNLSNIQAMQLAIDTNSVVRFDETAQSPFFNYTDENDRRHEVWFEDARSIRAKLRLIPEYGLAGISWWTANRLFRPALYVQQSMFSTEKVI